MKKLLWTLPLFLVATTPLKAADAPDATAPTSEAAQSYDQLIEKAQQDLKLTLIKESGIANLRRMEAARSFEKAAAAAPNDETKLKALLQAGELFTNRMHGNSFSPSARYADGIRVLENALKIASLSPSQRANVQLLLADANYHSDGFAKRNATRIKLLRGLYANVLNAPSVNGSQKYDAHSRLATLAGQEDNLLELAKQYELASQIAGISTNDQKLALNYAFYNLKNDEKKKSSPEIVTVITRFMPRFIALETDAVKQIDLRFSYAQLLQQYGAPAKSYEVWGAIADDAKLSIGNRARAVSEIAAQRIADKQPALGIKAWERVKTWPKPPAGEAGYDYQRAISLGAVYEAMGDETKLRAELATILTQSGRSDSEKATANFHTGVSHTREIKKLQASSTRTSAPTLAKIAAHEAAAIKAFETVWSNKKSGAEMRVDAATQHAQIENTKKRYVEARAILQKLVDEFFVNDRLLVGVSDDQYVMPLMKNVAQLYVNEKLYGDAAATLASAMIARGNDQEATNTIIQMWRTSLAQKSWDEARQTLTVMTNLGLSGVELYLAQLELEVGMKNWTAAVSAYDWAVRLADAMHDTPQKAEHKKAIAQFGAQIPVEVMEPARKKANEAFADGMMELLGEESKSSPAKQP